MSSAQLTKSKIIRSKVGDVLSQFVNEIIVVESESKFHLDITAFSVGYPFIVVFTPSKIELIKNNTSNKSNAFLCGQFLTPFRMIQEVCYRTLTITLHPWAIMGLFGVAPQELFEEQIEFELVSKDTSDFLTTLLSSNVSSEDLIIKVKDYLRKSTSRTCCDFRVRKIWKSLLINKGSGTSSRYSEIYGISNRRLQQLFKFYIGTTFSKYKRILRIQNYANSVFSLRYDKNSEGFHDQSHLIKEVKQMIGMTPSCFEEYSKSVKNKNEYLYTNIYHQYEHLEDDKRIENRRIKLI